MVDFKSKTFNNKNRITIKILNPKRITMSDSIASLDELQSSNAPNFCDTLKKSTPNLFYVDVDISGSVSRSRKHWTRLQL